MLSFPNFLTLQHNNKQSICYIYIHFLLPKHDKKLYYEQDHQALLKAKYCPQVAAASCTQKNTKNPCDLDLWPMTLKFNRVLEVVEVHVRAKFHQAKCSGSWVTNSWTRLWTTVDFDGEYLWNGSNNRQRKTALSTAIFSTFDENNLVTLVH